VFKYVYNKIGISIMKLKSAAAVIKNILTFTFSGFTIFFIAMLFFITVHDTMTGESSNTAEYCAKYGFLASRGC
jgi:hypothetical protein